MTTLTLPAPIALHRSGSATHAGHLPTHDRPLWPWLVAAIVFAPLVLFALVVCVACDVDLGGAS